MNSMKYFCYLIFFIALLPIGVFSQGAGNALDLDGLDDYVRVASLSGDELNPTEAVTVECWVYIQETISTSHRPHLIVKGVSYGLIIETNSHLKFYINDGAWHSVEGVSALNLNTWYHVVGVYDNLNNIFSIYLNGVLENLDATDYGTLSQNDNDVELGTFTTSSDNYANAIMDEIRIWSEARSEADIRTNMCRKLSGSETNLVGYWRLDESSGNTANDLTSYNNDGTLTNMNGNEWSASGAAIGDASAYSYPVSWTGETITLSHSDGDTLGIGNVSGAPDGIHIYRVDEAPNVTTPPATLYNLDPLRYWGVFIVGGTSPSYSLGYTYTGHPGITNENGLALALRNNNADATWVDASATLNTGLDLLSLANETGGEYILASATSDNPLPVNLISFFAIGKNESVELKWSTASEIDNDGYIVYRSSEKDGNYNEIDSYKYNNTLKGGGNISKESNYSFIDYNVINGQTYWYKIADVDINGNRTFHGPIAAVPQKVEIENIKDNLPIEFNLSQNYPNPFNPSTTINFDVAEVKNGFPMIKLNIYNMLGEKVRTLYQGLIAPGSYEVKWYGRNDLNMPLPSGVYIYQLISPKAVITKKMMLVK